MLYQIRKGTKHFGVNEVFEDINFEVNENEKIALIGRNGSGKSTLLKIMMGKDELSNGQIFMPNGLRIGYLSQQAFIDETISVQKAMDEAFRPIKEIEAKLESITKQMEIDHSDKLLDNYSKIHTEFELLGGYNYQNEMETILTKFGFTRDDLLRSINTFSGGQKTRIAFVRLLVSKPDILLLDEPTNHLDLKTIEWLEGYLKHYPRSIVLVSHDRVFIDNIANIIYELEFGKIKRYMGNYSSFEINKQNDQLRNAEAIKRQQKEIERLEELIEKFRYKATKASFAQSKIKQLDRIERIQDETKSDNKTFKANFTPRIQGGKTVLSMKDLKVGYDSELLRISHEIYKGDRICIMGDNGTGKSTLLKTLVDKLKPLGGNFLFGHQIEVGYFDQELTEFKSNKTVLDEVWEEYPELDRTSIRTLLGNFLFSADDVFKSVNVLSGGEKVRLSFVKLVLKKPNLLILDEPTNHLDILGKEALEKALKDYTGTIIFVSHDRYFIKKIATSCLLLDNGSAKYYENGYGEYIEQAGQTKEVKKVVRNENSRTNKTKLRNIETKIDELETTLKILEAKRFEEEYYEDYEKLQALENDIDKCQKDIDIEMEKWSALHE